MPTLTLTQTVDIILYCTECGDGLHYKTTQQGDNQWILEVAPCRCQKRRPNQE